MTQCMLQGPQLKKGIVPGGGTVYIKAISALNKVKGENEDQNVGIEIVKKALKHLLNKSLIMQVKMVL